MKKTKISVRIPEELGKEVTTLAEKAGRSKASILAEALEIYIERQTWKRERPEDWQ